MKKTTLFFAGLIALTVLGCSLSRESVSVIPIPLEFEKKDGRFIINSETRIFVDSSDTQISDIARDFAKLLHDGGGLNLRFARQVPSEIQLNFIYFSIAKPAENLGPEDYSLQVSENSILIRAKNPAGFYYAVQTLRHLLPPELESNQPVTGQIWAIPCLTILDKPRFSWRGMHLDVCRHFFPTEFVKKYIDILALHKINRFHWHLTEDQGWRIEIQKYPRLTEIGAWRVDREHQYWRRRQPQQSGEKATYGGYYTQEEIREIVSYASERFITIIPEIEMPGHATAALAAYPQLSCTGGPFSVYPGSYWPIEDIFCAGNDSTFIYLEGILDEVCDLFPGEFVHIGGDEANKARWEECRKCQQRIATEGLENEHELQSYFIRRIEKFLNSKGKRLIGWDEILEGGLAPNATVMSWRGMHGGIEAANAGHDVVMTPTIFCYFDYYQGLHDEPLAIGGFLPIEKVYEFDPIPASIESSKRNHILGGQANLWTEFIPTPEHAEYMLLPRLAALSEAVWSAPHNRDFNDFSNRLLDYYDRLAWMDLNFRVPPPENMGGSEIFFDDITCTIEAPFEDSRIRYTLDGTDPDHESLLYEGSFEIDRTTWVKARTVLRNGRMSLPATRMFHRVDPDINGLRYSYYEGEFDSLPDLSTLQPVKSGHLYDIDLKKVGNRRYKYAILFEGEIAIETAGEYTFYLIAEDMGTLTIGETVVVDNSGPYGPFEATGSAQLDAGRHKLNLLFFQKYGMAQLFLHYKPPGGIRQPVPGSLFIKPEKYPI